MGWNTGVFTRTNGVYSGASVWASDRDAGTKITAAHHDTHDQDLAQGINACAAKDGSNTVTILNLSGTVNSTSGIINVGSLVLASSYGTNNAFFGGAGNFTVTGIGSNSGFGAFALLSMTTASQSSAFGTNALAALTSGTGNTAVGNASLIGTTTGSSNSALGSLALENVTTGSSNIGVGGASGLTVTTGSKNIVIGTSCDVPSASANGQLSLANALYGTGNTGTAGTPSTGNLGAYVQAPTARFHLPAGTATAGTAPLKLTAGTVLGTPEDGALEYDGTHLWFTHGVTRTQIV